jgi:hypothetical protein
MDVENAAKSRADIARLDLAFRDPTIEILLLRLPLSAHPHTSICREWIFRI